jgi:phosphoglycerate dehydrogenase-like enzyme
MPVADSSVVAILGASAADPPPGLEQVIPGCDLRFAETSDQLTAAADAEVAYIWPPRADWLSAHWGWSSRLRWIATSTVGVDWLLFPELVSSDVIITNSAGLFDDAMAEYALALVAAVRADLHTTLRLQQGREWVHREITRLAGSQVIVAGVGGIGRAIAGLLARAGASVTCVGRSGRTDPELGWIAPVADLGLLLPSADFVILALPLTPATAGLIGSAALARMGPGSWLINLGRGGLVDEQALIGALRDGVIGGAALDVFEHEPLPSASPLWTLPNVIVSPHMSADFQGWEQALVNLFLRQLASYRAGQPLSNVVDKELGFVTAGPRPARRPLG